MGVGISRYSAVLVAVLGGGKRPEKKQVSTKKYTWKGNTMTSNGVPMSKMKINTIYLFTGFYQ